MREKKRERERRLTEKYESYMSSTKDTWLSPRNQYFNFRQSPMCVCVCVCEREREREREEIDIYIYIYVRSNLGISLILCNTARAIEIPSNNGSSKY